MSALNSCSQIRTLQTLTDDINIALDDPSTNTPGTVSSLCVIYMDDGDIQMKKSLGLTTC